MLTYADWCGMRAMRAMRAMQVGFFVIYVTPVFFFFVLPLGYVYFKVQDFYRNSSRELKRLEAGSKSPIFSHFSETLNGLSTIRAFNTQAKASRTRPNSVFTCFTGTRVHILTRREVQWRFFESSRDLNDAFSRAYFNNNASNRWLAVRLELIGNMAVGSAALFAVLQAT